MLMQTITLKRSPSPPVVATTPPLHVAIICDGNGRWATAKGMPRASGHRAGAEAAKNTIRCAPHLGVHTLTLFALSSSNWKRPPAEVNAILKLLQEYLEAEKERCLDEGVRLSIIGRRDRFPAELRETILQAEALTSKGTTMHLRLAVDYSARHSLFQAATKFYKATSLSPEAFGDILAEVQRGGSTEVDLLIRTGGEQRLSDFLLWECAFAELVFLDKRWPDFTPVDLRNAIVEFRSRERTRGALPQEFAS
jgi:undecaprenyl diphosphate synthase